jgi:hypothetical protein
MRRDLGVNALIRTCDKSIAFFQFRIDSPVPTGPVRMLSKKTRPSRNKNPHSSQLHLVSAKALASMISGECFLKWGNSPKSPPFKSFICGFITEAYFLSIRAWRLNISYFIFISSGTFVRFYTAKGLIANQAWILPQMPCLAKFGYLIV